MDDADERARTRRGRRRFLLGVLGGAVVFAVVSLLVGLAAAGDGSFFRWGQGEPPPWAAVAGPVLALLGLSVEIVGIVRGVRSGRYRAGHESRLRGVDRRRRRELVRGVRRGVVDAEQDLPLLRHTARQMADQRWFLLPFAGLVVMQLGQALLHWSEFWLGVGVLSAVGFALAAGQLVRDGHRAEAFLRAHPEPSDASGPGGASGPVDAFGSAAPGAAASGSSDGPRAG